MEQQDAIQPANLTPTSASKGVEASRLAIRSSVTSPAGDVLFNTIMGLNVVSKANQNTLLNGDWALKEVECAREFNFDLPVNLEGAIECMEQAVRAVMHVQKCAILCFDEQTGRYICLSNLNQADKQPRELPCLSDGFLQALLDTEDDVIHSHLVLENNLVGLVAISGKIAPNPETFDKKDQMLLDLLAPYLANKVSRFLQLKQSQSVPYIQSVVLDLAGRLVTAVDQDAIMTALLETFCKRLGFDACQYVGFSAETGIGEILYEIRNSAKPKVESFSHAGLEGKRRTVREFSNLVGLLSSMARNKFYLHLNGKKLGNRPLGEIFGIKNIQSALLLPVVDMATGEIRGTFNLFHTTDALISNESREIACEAVQLASQALSRALVLEKALAMASSDELTGLINRRGYYQRFEAELERARRHQTPLCVALIDVDHFKHFNDTYGHLSGDLVLKALAELFTQNMRKSDVVCRFGGEEFAILLPDTGLKSAVELMERVRQNVEKLHLYGFNGESLHVTISIGLAEVNTKPKVSPYRSEISDVLALADEQLYQAKHQGRNQVCYIQPDSQSSVQQAG